MINDRTPTEIAYDALIAERRAQGRKTYGKGLEHTDTKYDWLRMALEEAMDMGQYLMAEVLRLQDCITELEDLNNGV